MLKALVTYALVVGCVLAVVAISVHMLMARQYRSALPERLINISHNAEEALERAPAGTPVALVLASALDSPDEGLAWFDPQGRLVGRAGKPATPDSTSSRTRIREERVDGWIQVIISNERIANALQQLDLGLTIGTIVAMLVAGLAISAISSRSVARVEAALRRVHRFTGDAAHELRTPLAVIASNADHLVLDASDGAARERGLTNIRHAARQMRELMDGLLILARVDEGVAEDLHAVDLDACVEGVVRTHHDEATRRGLTLRIVTRSKQTVYGQPEQVARIVGNLVENALHYTPAGGTIELACTKERNAAVVRVTDSGIGIAREQLPHVFDRFWRAGGPGNAEGSGLGLAIARGLARAHGGEVSAASRFGEGSTFTVRLPLHPQRVGGLSTVS